MRRILLKNPDEKCMNFIYKKWYIYNFMKMMGMGENPRKKIEQNKHSSDSLPSHLYKMDSDCFLVSEGTEKQASPFLVEREEN